MMHGTGWDEDRGQGEGTDDLKNMRWSQENKQAVDAHSTQLTNIVISAPLCMRWHAPLAAIAASEAARQQ